VRIRGRGLGGCDVVAGNGPPQEVGVGGGVGEEMMSGRGSWGVRLHCLSSHNGIVNTYIDN
jgi:hypothetical protein